MKSTMPLVYPTMLGCPFVHALLLPRVPAQRARLFAILGSSATLLISFMLVAPSLVAPAQAPELAELGIGPFALHFGLDALNAPLVLLLNLLTVALVAGSSAVLASAKELRALLWLQFITLLTLTSQDLPVLALGFALALLPAFQLLATHHSRVLKRVYGLYHGLGVLCILGAAAALGYWVRAPAAIGDHHLFHYDTHSVPPTARTVLFALLAVAALIRMGVAPFHSWLPVALEQGSFYGMTLLVSIRTGLYVLARVALPAFPDAAKTFMPTLTTFATLSALYGAIAAFGQSNLRRMVAFLVVSQSGIMLTGLCFANPDSVSGTLLYWLGFGVATTGMMLMLGCLEGRVGTCDMRECGGLVRGLPQLSGCFFLFGLATIAIPGTVAFAAEDMLVHGSLEAHPLLTFLMLGAMLLNAITFMRGFATAFLGNENPRNAQYGSFVDLLTRERVVAVGLLLTLIVAGALPSSLVSVQIEAARAIAFVR